MNVKIDGLIFQSANYDADGDVLYLSRGDRDGHLTITLPHLVRIGADELATALS